MVLPMAVAFAVAYVVASPHSPVSEEDAHDPEAFIATVDFSFLLPDEKSTEAGGDELPRWTAEDVYYYQVHAFYRDLMATGRVPDGRARRMAQAAVDEALRLRVPPALVFGVMLVENAAFDPFVRGGVGEVGLMQVRPNIWLPELGPSLGWDLEDEVTNIRFGVAILRRYANKSRGNWEETLLRYNGWGPQYPGRVRNRVEEHGTFLCPSGSFDQCVSRPLLRWTQTLQVVAR